MENDKEARADHAEALSVADNNLKISGDGSDPPYTPEEEARVLRKVDMIVMPLLWFGLIMLQLDRGNIGNALTDNFLGDVGIDQNTLNVGQQLLQAAIVIFEIPSNLVLYRIGPTLWITLQIFAWGLVATFQAFQSNRAEFLATRFLLGAFEAGFQPAAFYTLTTWYKPSELSKRFGIFYSGNLFALALGGIVAYGILHMRGVANMAGWQWLFIIEGILTLVVGAVFGTLFPASPSQPKSLARICLFNEEERAILQWRLITTQGGPDVHGEKKHITLKDLWRTFLDPKLWPHLFVALFTFNAGIVYALYGPTIIASFGYEPLRANALSSVGQWLSLILVIGGGYIADWWGRRGILVVLYLSCTFITVLAFRLLPDNAPMGTKYAVLTLGIGTALWSHPLNGSWLAVNARSPQDRAIRMALIVMGANLAGVMAPQLLRADDAPHYPRGWSILSALTASALALAIGLVVTYALLNARTRKRDPAAATDERVGRGGVPSANGFAVDGARYYNY